MNRGFATMVAVALRVGLLMGCLAPSAAAQCMKWVLRTDVANPGSQVGHAMAYHSDRQRVMIFTSDVAADLWEYDGFQWLRVSVTGPRPSPGSIPPWSTIVRGRNWSSWAASGVPRTPSRPTPGPAG